MAEYTVADADEIDVGERILVQIEGKPIGIFNIDNEYVAYLSWCAHQSGPCAEGNITGTKTASFDPDTLQTDLEYVKEGEILNCPWHGWEYDLQSGECLSRDNISLASFPVSVDDGKIVVTM
ncbi:Rieske (2Fe-2S) protein [Natrinema caseinilyticum]|uniref:Rieske (2Fe-2S) protein n=1 Tax=Natrinema caseinilyticum TaxID=2961570 RepID=UPI0020C3862C|nr:Rieske 2Fe-2S domain-containing protein [Natrinema caseinilyticum]